MEDDRRGNFVRERKSLHRPVFYSAIERRNCARAWSGTDGRWETTSVFLHGDSTYASSRAFVGSAMNVVEVVQKQHRQEILWNVIASNSPALA